eukprot:5056719-Karenia_brevis.AAC.1
MSQFLKLAKKHLHAPTALARDMLSFIRQRLNTRRCITVNGPYRAATIQLSASEGGKVPKLLRVSCGIRDP